MSRIMHTLAASAIVSLAALETLAWAQAPAPPPSAGGSGLGTVAAVVLIAAFLVVVIAVVKMFDRKRRRDDEDMSLEAHVSDALMTDPEVAALPIAAHVERSGWGPGAPTVVTVTGQAPTAERREAALAVVRREVLRVRPDARIEPQVDVPERRAA